MSLRILVADRFILFRQAVVAALRQEGLEVIGQASSGRDAVEQCRLLRPEVAVLDLSMSPLNGIEAAREIIPFCHKTRVVILSEYTAEVYVRESLRAGAKGYVLKTATASELAEAIYAVSNGITYISRSVSHAVEVGVEATELLGARERRVLRLIAEGKGTKEIADILGITNETVRSHRKHIIQKLDIHDTAGLVRYSVHHGLLEARFDLQR